MKTRKLFVFVSILAIAGLTAAFTKTSDTPSIVIIRTVEKPNGAAMQKSALAVYKDGVVSEQTELEELNGKSLDHNLKIIGDLISKYRMQGYEIKSVAGAGAVNSLTYNYILEKRQ